MTVVLLLAGAHEAVLGRYLPGFRRVDDHSFDLGEHQLSGLRELLAAGGHQADIALHHRGHQLGLEGLGEGLQISLGRNGRCRSTSRKSDSRGKSQ